MVEVFSKPGCGACDLVKNYLLENGIKPEIRNIHGNKENLHRLKSMGFDTLPVTIVEGGEPIVGFDLPKLKQLVADRKA